VSKEEVITAIKEAAATLGHSPNLPDMKRMCGLTDQDIRKYFGTMRRALHDAGLEPKGSGHVIDLKNLFLNWAAVARKLGKVPSKSEYAIHGKYSATPLLARYRVWAHVPVGLREFAERNGLEQEYADVLAMVTEHQKRASHLKRPVAIRAAHGEALVMRPRVMPDRPVFGPPIGQMGLGNEPTSELCVVYLFGMLAPKLGFVVMRIQREFPDCIAWREVEPGRWQQVDVEFELESRNFAEHGHDPKGCDLIVCWVHNWQDCPPDLEVIELSEVMRKAAGSY
jgi:hypothetical protein